MDVDVAIIGAGPSGLAAGVRLAYFDKRVCILERHYAYGGMNSYYRLDGREFDVGLHALTNYVPATVRKAPLPKLLRQLRLSREELDLCPQGHSEVRFPGRQLRFSNDTAELVEEVAREFPAEIDRFRSLLACLSDFDDTRLDVAPASARAMLTERLHEPALREMLLCPTMYYGCPTEHDMDLTAFVTIFKAVFLQGLARPRGGVRAVLKALVRKFRSYGGRLRMRTGVSRIDVADGRVRRLVLDSGEELTAGVVLSCAGWGETQRLCGVDGSGTEPLAKTGRLTFVEWIACLDTPPRQLGFDPTIVFYSDTDRFDYASPASAFDVRSGIACCPNNYEDHEDTEPRFRMTWLASHGAWSGGDAATYGRLKAECHEMFLSHAGRFVRDIGRHVTFTDLFTPRTIERYTGRLGGAVYGAPTKCRDGRTGVENLFLIGTDQGFLGIVGAMLSGVTIANARVLDA